MKKFILFFLIIFSITSYSITIKVISENNKPINRVTVDINKKIDKTDSNGAVRFDNLKDILNISIYKSGYRKQSVTITNNRDLVLIIKLIKNNSDRSNITFTFSVPKGTIEYRKVGIKKYFKIAFNRRFKIMIFPFGDYDFIFSNTTNEKIYKRVNINNKNLNIYTNFNSKKRNYSIIGNISNKNEINFSKNSNEEINPAKNLTVLITKKGSSFIRTIKLQDKFIPLNLEDGTYNFKIIGKFYSDFDVKNIKFDSSTKPNIIVSTKHLSAEIHGNIKNKKQFIGGVKVTFTDLKNHTYEVISSFDGSFNIIIPPGKYKVSIKKYGFYLDSNKNSIYNFSSSKKIYSLKLSVKETLSRISGTVTDTTGIPIQNSVITIKNGDSKTSLKSNKFGEFSGITPPGLIFIKVNKYGYKSYGLVTTLERVSTLTGLKISLTPFLSDISGTVVNDYFPLKNLPLTLRNKSGKAFARTKTTQNGYYKFSDIPINNDYFITVSEPSYKYYTSKNFILTKDSISDKNIILKQRKVKILLEFKTAVGHTLSKKEIFINNKRYYTDSNGFLILNLPENSENITVKVNSYKYSKFIDLKYIYDKPYLISLIIK